MYRSAQNICNQGWCSHVFVYSIALDGREAELLDKLVLEILNVAFFCSNLESLGLCCFEVFFLADGGHEADHIVTLLDEPGENTGGVEAAAVGETDSLLLRHLGGVEGFS